ncbi:hypothetical protein D9757_005262 [Collybiopsis confluens]|uniref:Uncharacterized protein n=1 Tax=Collybiopsis confluens TaxID=2823264 RepID=A0A8H5HVY9_9AGAR|nr:hypothetical protein D9757_005262 [Collybiopsis confluens]
MVTANLLHQIYALTLLPSTSVSTFFCVADAALVLNLGSIDSEEFIASLRELHSGATSFQLSFQENQTSLFTFTIPCSRASCYSFSLFLIITFIRLAMSVVGEISAGIAIFNLISSLVDRARPAVQKKLPHRILSDGRAILDSEENIRRFNRLVELAPPIAKALQIDRDRAYRKLETTLVACDAGKKRWNVKIRLELFHKAEGVYNDIQVYERVLHNASSSAERDANRRTLMSIPSIADLRHDQFSGHLDVGLYCNKSSILSFLIQNVFLTTVESRLQVQVQTLCHLDVLI